MYTPIVTAFAGLSFVFGVLWLLVRLVRGWRRPSIPKVRSAALACGVGIVALFAAPFVAQAVAGVLKNWNELDSDGDGFQDGFEAGAYDWVGVVGPTFVVIWLVMNLVILAAVWLLSIPSNR